MTLQNVHVRDSMCSGGGGGGVSGVLVGCGVCGVRCGVWGVR